MDKNLNKQKKGYPSAYTGGYPLSFMVASWIYPLFAARAA